MNTPPVESNSPVQSATITKKKRGCFFWGCMGCLGFSVVLLIALVILSWFLRGRAIDFAQKRSSQQPLEMREVTLPEDSESLEQRWGDIENTIHNNGTGTYTINQEMVDFLIYQNNQQQNEQLFDVILGSGDVNLLLSIPLDKTPIRSLHGRYFNMLARITFSYQNGRLQAYIQDLQIPGKAIPTDILTQITSENLGPSFYREEAFVKFIQKFNSITFSGSSMLLEFNE